MAKPNELFLEFFLGNLENFTYDQKKFKEEFNNVVGNFGYFKRTKTNSTNWKWWFKNFDEIIEEFKNPDSKKFKSEFNNLAKLLNKNVLDYLRRTFNNEHIKIGDKSLKEYFKTVIVPNILVADETKNSKAYINLLNNSKFTNLSSDNSEELNEQWNLYLQELKKGNFIDPLTTYALGNILNKHLQYNDEEDKPVEIKCNKKIDLCITLNDKNKIHLKQLSNSFATTEQIQQWKKDKNKLVMEIEINPVAGSVEEQIVKHLLSQMQNESDKVIDKALKNKKEIIFIVKTDQLIDSNKLQEILKTKLAEKHGQDNVKVDNLCDSSQLTSSSKVDHSFEEKSSKSKTKSLSPAKTVDFNSNQTNPEPSIVAVSLGEEASLEVEEKPLEEPTEAQPVMQQHQELPTSHSLSSEEAQTPS